MAFGEQPQVDTRPATQSSGGIRILWDDGTYSPAVRWPIHDTSSTATR